MPCIFKPSKGPNAGIICGKDTAKDCELCASHKKYELARRRKQNKFSSAVWSDWNSDQDDED